MAVVEGFRGVRFSLTNGNDISDRIAPPYDVLDEQDKADLLKQSPNNIVAIDLPHMPPRSAGPQELYTKAGDLLRSWLEDGVMIRDEKPTIYVYQQRYSYQNKEYTRRGFIARMKVEPFCESSVFPHEKTHGGPKEDRMMLTKATQANMSQIFCLIDDDTNEITNTLYSKISAEPTYTGEVEGVQNDVWTITDVETINWVSEKMKARKAFIADGHHRYTTSLNYKNELESAGKLTPDHPANYVGCMFVSMSEPGLAILPTHRAITQMAGVTLDDIASLLEADFEISWFDGTADEAEVKMNELADVAFAFTYTGDKRTLMAKPKDLLALLADMADEHILAWRTLPVAVLHAKILDQIIFPKYLKTEKPAIEYFHLASEVSEFMADAKDVLGVLTPTTKIEAVKEISLAGELMPQKSTFFYPKIATGLVIHPLFD